MKNPLLKFIYDRKKVGSRTKEAAIELRITYEGKQKYISTGIRVLPHHWKEGYNVIDRMDADELNEALGLMMKNRLQKLNIAIWKNMSKKYVTNTNIILNLLKKGKY